MRQKFPGLREIFWGKLFLKTDSRALADGLWANRRGFGSFAQGILSTPSGTKRRSQRSKLGSQCERFCQRTGTWLARTRRPGGRSAGPVRSSLGGEGSSDPTRPLENQFLSVRCQAILADWLGILSRRDGANHIELLAFSCRHGRSQVNDIRGDICYELG